MGIRIPLQVASMGEAVGTARSVADTWKKSLLAGKGLQMTPYFLPPTPTPMTSR